ncbi:glycosyltransferase family 4 protein [Yersinia sp. J1]|uniref:glycosyltransferase family 4 protein n=1 Tax=Yersinia sp. J1 TaxID=3424774 RepID=UPI003D366B2C
MKILYIIPSFLNAGPVNVCFTLVQELSQVSNDNIHVYALKSGNKKHDFNAVGCVTEVFPLRSILAMIRKIKAEEFDVIHSHCLIPDFILAVLKIKCVKISTIHNFIDIDYIYSKGRVIGRMMGLINRFSLNRMDMAVGCSKSVADYCSKLYHIKKITYIRNGVLDNFDGRYLEGREKINFFYLGVINKRKNPSILLESFVKWNVKNIHSLHIIGGGDELEKYRTAYKNENIIFYGNVSNPLSLIINMDCFVSSSKAEGLPLALLEAICLGKQFICSNIPPHQEVVDLCEPSTGIIVDNTVEDFVKGFELLTMLDIEISSYYSRQAYLNHFSSNIMAEKYRALYVELLASKPE